MPDDTLGAKHASHWSLGGAQEVPLVHRGATITAEVGASHVEHSPIERCVRPRGKSRSLQAIAPASLDGCDVCGVIASA